jgi:aromatic ring-opening dioxygenase catalytic subunit (LigB family)
MKMPTYFISHGGGPWPYMPETRQSNAALAASLQNIPEQIGRRPAAIVMVSAHWETEGVFKVMAQPNPAMLYDYYGFPESTYHVHYSAPGSPAVAQEVSRLLKIAQLPIEFEHERGFDHGAFVPASLMYPSADVPMIQLSIQSNYAPGLHMALGRALAPLRDQEILVIGSGLSYHNLRQMGGAGKAPSAEFDAWLQKILIHDSADQRAGQLENWIQAPAARQAHPREDHLIPLMVAAGAAETEAVTCIYHETGAFGGITASSFRFGVI